MYLATHFVQAAAEKNPNPLLPDAGELVFGILAFFVVFGFLGWKLLPRISQTLEERTDAIEGGLERAKQAQQEANQKLDEYRAALTDARREAARMREEAREEGARIIAEMREQAQVEANRIVEQAHTQIEADRQQAFAQLRSEIGQLSVELAGRVVGESLEDEARRRGTVDRFLDELEERTRARA